MASRLYRSLMDRKADLIENFIKAALQHCTVEHVLIIDAISIGCPEGEAGKMYFRPTQNRFFSVNLPSGVIGIVSSSGKDVVSRGNQQVFPLSHNQVNIG